MYAPEGLFQYLQMVAGVFSVPIFTIVFVGYISKRVPSIAAKIALTVFFRSYAAMWFSNSLPTPISNPIRCVYCFDIWDWSLHAT